jgi:hypothetical protein
VIGAMKGSDKNETSEIETDSDKNESSDIEA